MRMAHVTTRGAADYGPRECVHFPASPVDPYPLPLVTLRRLLLAAGYVPAFALFSVDEQRLISPRSLSRVHNEEKDSRQACHFGLA